MLKNFSKKVTATMTSVTTYLFMTGSVLATQAEITAAWSKVKTFFNVWAFAMTIFGILGVATVFITAGDDETKQASAKKWSIGIMIAWVLIGLGPTIAHSLIF